MEAITVWERYCKQDNGEWVWEHNHIENGHCSNDFPTLKFETQKRNWSSGKWRKFLKHLNEASIVV